MRQRWLPVIISTVAVCGCCQAAFGKDDGTFRSPEQQQAVNAALDTLMSEQSWDAAQKVVERYLDEPLHNAVFFEKAIITYWHQSAYQQARALAEVAQILYPDYAPFYGYHAQLLAREGHCARARTSWAHYRRLAYFPLPVSEVARFDSYCDVSVKQRASIAQSISREERLSPLFGTHRVKAETGSQLEQLCSLLAGLCQEDLIFLTDRPPPPRNAFILRYHSSIEKQHNWRHGFGVGLSLNRHIGGYRKRQADFHARWSYRLSATRLMGVRIGASHAFVPSFADYAAQHTLSPYLEWRMDEQLSGRVRTDIVWRHSAQETKTARQTITTHLDSLHNGLYWQPSAAQEWGVRLLANSIRPPQNDAYGDQLRKGFGLHYAHQDFYKMNVTLGYERTQTRVAKSLPFLSRPHRIVEKRTFLSLSRPAEHLFGIIPFVTVGEVVRRSDNPREHGTRRTISFGLSFRL